MPKEANTFENMDLSEAIQNALKLNGVRFDQIEFLRYSVNKNYKIITEQPLFLRVYRPGKETSEQIQAEHDFLNFLKANEFGVAAPVRLKNGDSFGEIQTPTGPTFFAVFEYIEGSHPTDLNEFAFNWGRSLGNLHSLSREFGKKHMLHTRRTWSQSSWVVNSEKLLQEIATTEQKTIFLQERDRVLAYLNRLPESLNEFGLVHYDFHPGNILIKNGKTQILDFDDCCKSWFVWDFALPMHRLGGHMSNQGAKQKSKFIQGYRETAILSPKWESRIGHFERIRHLFMLCWLSERQKEEKWREVASRYARAHGAYLASHPNIENS